MEPKVAKLVRKIAFPCAVCDKACGTKTIHCETGCGLWIHQACVPMSDAEFLDLSNSADYFLCPKCVYTTNKEKVFDFHKCLRRLKGVPTTASALSERRLITLYKAKVVDYTGPNVVFGLEDSVSVEILRKHHGVMLESNSPRSTVGDGNCFYRAASLALFGTQDSHVYLRVLTALELMENRGTYDMSSPSPHTDFINSAVPPSTYDTLLASATTLGSYAEMAIIYALSAAVGCVIQSYMPPTSAIGLGNPYTKTVVGRGLRNTGSAKFTVMWTMMSVPMRSCDFKPNHFVYLAELQDSQDVVNISATSLDADDKVDVMYDDSTNDELAAMDSSADEELELNTNTNGELGAMDSSADEELELNTDAVLVNEEAMEQPSSPAPPTPPKHEAATIVAEKCPGELYLHPLPPDEALPTDFVIGLLTRSISWPVAPSVPFGKKSNVFVVVDNSANVKRKMCNKYNVFDDDCGAWSSSSSQARTIKMHYIHNESAYRKIFWVAGQEKYCRETKSGGKRSYIPYDPQPDPADVVIVDRYYTTLLANKSYKKRVSWMASGYGSGEIAVYEYIGIHVTGQPHGNVKEPRDKEPFARTPALTMDKISSLVQCHRTQDVYGKLIVQLDVNEAPRDSRVVRNKKTSDHRAEKMANGQSLCATFADEFQTVFDMLKTNDFVRRVVGQKDNVPSVILYSDRQIAEIRSFCFDKKGGAVLGFDKTFNLGSIYVTVSVYKNLALVRNRSGETPIFIGPLFLHGRSDVNTYSDFFGHLSAQLMGCDFQALTLGSDDELAMRKCIMHFFTRATTVVCSRHLRENVGRKLDELVGKSSEVRRLLFEAIFGASGLISLDNVVSFDEAIEKLRKRGGVLEQGPSAFKCYFEQRIVKLMRDNCTAGLSTWTNNNSESINHVLKQVVQWRPNQLPDLIDRMKSLVDGQYADADRALCGRGDFSLQPQWATHRLTVDVWSKMTPSQRQKAIKRCFCLPGPPTSLSSDGVLTVPTTPGQGKKLNQKKRCRTNRTTTTVKKVKLEADNSNRK